jgi:hypothetical protein
MNEAGVETPVAEMSEIENLRAALVRQQISFCSYCGHEVLRASRPEEEFRNDIQLHILECEKRPERRLIAALYSIVVPLRVNVDLLPQGDLDALADAVQKRWDEEISLRDKQIDALMTALGQFDAFLNTLGASPAAWKQPAWKTELNEKKNHAQN